MVRELVENGRKQLLEAPFEVSSREAYLLLGHVLGLSEAQIMAHWDDEVSPEAESAFRGLLDRRLCGEPAAYLLGRREFYGRAFHVDRRVLIPRPDTEHLVEAALSLPLGKNPRILDLGTGSGCIAVTLALEHPGAAVVAVDNSIGALALAAKNARDLGAPNVRLLASDLAASIQDRPPRPRRDPRPRHGALQVDQRQTAPAPHGARLDRTGDQRRTTQGFGKEVTSLAFVGVTEKVVASSGDKTVRLVNTDNGKMERTYSGSNDFMYSTAISADGRIAISGGQDSTLFVWLVEGGQLLRSFAAPEPASSEPVAQASSN
ncbi:MAG: HemK family protein methyltransferase [Acidobacteria bacterium]|nr:HemK family protein methyltransferase [Acidobacteriota bacterium]